MATGYSFVRPVGTVTLGSHLLLGYRNYYTIHGGLYMSTHILIKNTLVQHKNAHGVVLPESSVGALADFIVVPVSPSIAPLLRCLSY